jgi:predicted O-linked N-acetylglucosamine transferase (SPINDLY family)
MDYVLMDPWHAPPGSEAQFTERVLRMPHSRFCFRPIDDAPAVADRVATSGGIRFGSFNNIAKVNPQVIQAWSRILERTPGSRLVLKWRTLEDAHCRKWLAAAFQSFGIAADRLDFRRESRHEEMLAEYGDIDIALDTFPFTGGQTSFEATWMGVPVITLAGNRTVSRQTLCLLGNLELESELSAQTMEGFVERAVTLARNPPRLRELRSTLRLRMQASPLMQAPEFARALVKALRDAAGSV